jgi:YggT family protein
LASTSSSTSTSSTSTSPAAPPAAPILALALAAVSSFRNRLSRGLSSAFAAAAAATMRKKQTSSSTKMTAEEKKHADDLVKRHVRSMRTLAAVAPLASITSTGSEHVLLLLTRSVASFIKLYLLFLFMRVLLSWFPAFNWDRQPWLTLRQLTDPYLNVFRGIIPPFFGMIDFTPLLGFFVLQWVQSLLETISAADSDAEGGFSSADDSPF